jgi:hypothetical protein
VRGEFEVDAAAQVEDVAVRDRIEDWRPGYLIPCPIVDGATTEEGGTVGADAGNEW